MSEAAAVPEAIEPVPSCPNCGSDNVRQVAIFYTSYECADCRLIFDTSIRNYEGWCEDEGDWWDDGRDWSDDE